MKKQLFFSIVSALLAAIILPKCSSEELALSASDYDFPTPVDTNSKTIRAQKKATFQLMDGAISADNQFDGARLNDFTLVNDTLIQAHISPENEPINDSPWYAFKIWSKESQDVYLQLKYSISKHRYHPKISVDGQNWSVLDSALIQIAADSSYANLKLALSPDTLWVAAQEIIDSNDVLVWADKQAQNPNVQLSVIGESKGGRPMYFMDIGNEPHQGKKVLVIFSRQHPPEVTGYFAMQSFVSEIVSGTLSDQFLEEYRVLVYPLLNPDGTDMGHWRHNMGGVDLNRDWAYYRQPETRLIADHVVRTVSENGGKVMLGLDFHSTWHDVYYTQDKVQMKTATTPWFREQWFESLENQIPGYKVNEKPSELRTPVTKGWFYTQFGAEGMTYEIGDNTPRDSIDVIGSISAEEMMRILLKGK